MSESNTGFRAPFNVVAAFSQGDDASVAVDVLAARGVPRPAITVHRPDEGATGDDVAELDPEMQDEPVRSWGILSGPQARRAFGAAFALGLVGIVLGVVAGFAWAYLFSSGLSRLARVMTVAGVAGLAGATIGFVDRGGGLTRRRGGEPDTDTQLAVERVLVALHVCDSELAGRTAALLRALGAERVELVDARGTPLPPQAQHPRPEDPKGWGRAGYG